MDPTGCPPGFLTDRLLLVNPDTLCSVTLGEFWGAVVVLCGCRLVACLAKLRSFILMYNTRQQNSQRRLPLGLLNSLWSTVSYFLLSILSGLNIANAGNGWTYSLYSMAYLGSAVDLTLMLFKLVRLGRRVIRLPRNQELGDTEYLTHFTHSGKVLMTMQLGMIIVSTIALMILSPVFPSQEILLGRLGFASKGVFQFLVTMGIVLQLERCVRALDAFRAQKLEGDDVRILRKISAARKMLRIRQLYITILSSIVGLVLILIAGDGLPWTWGWLLIGTAAPEAFGNIMVELVFNQKQHLRHGRTTDPVDAKVNNLQGDYEDNSEDRDVSGESLSKLSSKNKSHKKRKHWRLQLSRITEEVSRGPVSKVESELILASSDQALS